VRSRVLEAGKQVCVMSHHEIQSRTDFVAARVALQNQLSPLKQEGRLGSVFLGSELLQPAIEVLWYTQIHSHT
jgi:hypothetical protein